MNRTMRVVILAGLSGVLGLTLLQACSSCEDETEGGGAAGAPSEADIQAGEGIFTKQCVACHSIGGGDGVGPDLRNVHERREAEWLTNWMNDPMGMSKNDPVGQQLLKQFRDVPMPPQNLNAEQTSQVLAYIRHQSGQVEPAAAGEGGPVELGEEQFAQARKLYFDRCAGCHGTLRAGATGPNITPENTTKIGTSGIEAILTNGTPGGMPAWGRLGILSEAEIGLMARYIQLPPPAAPPRPLEDIRESWNLSIPVDQRPTEAPAGKNWENYFGIILRDAGQVAIIDGDSREKLAVIDTGFAVHILRSSSTGRYFYAVGRDGRVSLIDLWMDPPALVSQVQGCFDARSVDGSKFEGYEDRYVIEGCYWPPQYVVYDGLTLEPHAVIDVAGSTYDTNEPLEEVRVAAIIASHSRPTWIVALKESGHVGVVDYSLEGFPMVSRIPSERFLHDGGWDHTGRYFMVAANMRNHMVVIDTEDNSFVTKFETGNKPHPGRGANWEDPEFGWVNATPHIGEGLLAVYGADPAAHADHAWEVVRRIELEGTGSLFVKTHNNSPWVWVDFPLSNDDDQTRKICVYSKAEGAIDRCWSVADHGRVVHFEYNRAGTEVWVSVWDQAGELVVYNDRSLEEVGRITGDWLRTPTGKFNVYNTAHDIY
ncbi:MAG: c-type cytochrome [Myxococcales bacterium]|nr:c-type cytochrome [Myxococcales bacterium]